MKRKKLPMVRLWEPGKAVLEARDPDLKALKVENNSHHWLRRLSL
jgi:hypothetical protein